jgi:hypothetical protein
MVSGNWLKNDPKVNSYMMAKHSSWRYYLCFVGTLYMLALPMAVLFADELVPPMH